MKKNPCEPPSVNFTSNPRSHVEERGSFIMSLIYGSYILNTSQSSHPQLVATQSEFLASVPVTSILRFPSHATTPSDDDRSASTVDPSLVHRTIHIDDQIRDIFFLSIFFHDFGSRKRDGNACVSRGEGSRARQTGALPRDAFAGRGASFPFPEHQHVPGECRPPRGSRVKA